MDLTVFTVALAAGAISDLLINGYSDFYARLILVVTWAISAAAIAVGVTYITHVGYAAILGVAAPAAGRYVGALAVDARLRAVARQYKDGK